VFAVDHGVPHVPASAPDLVPYVIATDPPAFINQHLHMKISVTDMTDDTVNDALSFAVGFGLQQTLRQT
jgi:hypothetical protein